MKANSSEKSDQDSVVFLGRNVIAFPWFWNQIPPAGQEEHCALIIYLRSWQQHFRQIVSLCRKWSFEQPDFIVVDSHVSFQSTVLVSTILALLTDVITHWKENCHKCDKCSYATGTVAQPKIHCERVHAMISMPAALVYASLVVTLTYQMVDYLSTWMRNQHPKEREIRDQHLETFICPEKEFKYRTDSKHRLYRRLKTHNSFHWYPFPCSVPGCEYRARDRHRLKVRVSIFDETRNGATATQQTPAQRATRNKHPKFV